MANYEHFIEGRKRLPFQAGYRQLLLDGAFTATARLMHGGRQWIYEPGEEIALHAGSGENNLDLPATVYAVDFKRMSDLTPEDLQGCPPDQTTVEALRIVLSNVARRQVQPDDEVMIIRFKYGPWPEDAE